MPATRWSLALVGPILAISGCGGNTASATSNPAAIARPTVALPTGTPSSASSAQLQRLGIHVTVSTAEPAIPQSAALAVAEGNSAAPSGVTPEVRIDAVTSTAGACTCWVVVWKDPATQGVTVALVDEATGKWMGTYAGE